MMEMKEMGGARGTHGRNKRCIGRFRWRNLEERNHFGDPGRIWENNIRICLK
jgi:hypothetical protein